jgi:putative transposase
VAISAIHGWSDWRRALVIVEPQTVLGWHRPGLRLFWRWKARPRDGRPILNPELVSLIRQMWSSDPTWGSQRIQAELAKLGIAVPDSSIRKHRPRRHCANQTWTTFLRNHLKDFIAVDCYTVPTASSASSVSSWS